MNRVYTAIMRAADWIETHPERFDFGACDVPAMECGSPGCAIGWIGAFAGFKSGQTTWNVSEKLLGLKGDGDFYERMRAISAENGKHGYWRTSPKMLAKHMRLYASRYHASSLLPPPPSRSPLCGLVWKRRR
jgi:hypothetical protein